MWYEACRNETTSQHTANIQNKIWKESTSCEVMNEKFLQIGNVEKGKSSGRPSISDTQWKTLNYCGQSSGFISWIICILKACNCKHLYNTFYTIALGTSSCHEDCLADFLGNHMKIILMFFTISLDPHGLPLLFPSSTFSVSMNFFIHILIHFTSGGFCPYFIISIHSMLTGDFVSASHTTHCAFTVTDAILTEQLLQLLANAVDKTHQHSNSMHVQGHL